MMKQMMIHIERPLPGVATIILNRPEKRNALNIPLLEDLFNTIIELNLDSTINVVIIKGNGAAFCAGLDLSEAADPALYKYSGTLIKMTFSAIYNSPHTTIAVVHGAAIAGGAGLMCACDFALAAVDTKFAFPETQRGMVAALVLTLLSRQLNQRAVKELLLLGEAIDAEKALTIGLISRVAPYEELTEVSYTMARQIMKGAPGASSLTKQLIHELYPSKFEADLTMAHDYHEKARTSDEAVEGTKAFLDKRLPSWNHS